MGACQICLRHGEVTAWGCRKCLREELARADKKPEHWFDRMIREQVYIPHIESVTKLESKR